MLLTIIIFIGVLMFIPSVYLLIKNYKYGKYIKTYGLISYLGLVISYVGVLLSMESVFIRLPGALPGLLPFFITLLVFSVLSKLLLKPIFLRDKKHK